MNPGWYGAIGVIVAALITGVLARWTKKVDRADIAKKVSEAWDPLVDGLNTQIADIKTECTNCKTQLRLVRIDFGAFVDVVDELVPLLPIESQRKARVAINAARLSHLSHNPNP